MTRLTGRGVVPGVAIGRAVIAVRDASQVRYRLAASGVDRERQRLRAARERTRVELEEISVRVSRTIGDAHASIFAAQLLMLDDPLLYRQADALIRTQRINAEWALDRAMAELRNLLAREGDAWVRARIGDVADVGGRLQRNLGQGGDQLLDLVRDLEPPLILVTDELPPSVAAQLDWSHIAGLVTDVGGPTNHTVILVRSLNVPTVVGLACATQLIAPEQLIALDGSTGEIVIDPPHEIQERWRRRQAIATAGRHGFQHLRGRNGQTADGVRIHLLANLEIADEVARVGEAGAEGIGLYRSEFLLDPLHPDTAGEAAQENTYRDLLAALAPLPVTIRTFDAGADHALMPEVVVGHRERFGFRGVRGLLQRDERFLAQIRALLRASRAGVLRILLPFVTTSGELHQARRIIEEIRAGIGGVAPVPIGAMIEVPGAALTVDALAVEAEFLSVGTNDLIQYTLAVDRTDEGLAGHYEPASPAVLRLLHQIAVGARKTGRDIYVCGEMAADPLLVSLLVGFGFRSFSLTPAVIPLIKHSLRAIDTRQARVVARRALRAQSADEVERMLAPVAETLHRAAAYASEEPA
jgi:phosphotransferase system enzyme I (PtsI)